MTPRKNRHAATLADVGREAGVSAMAASAVLNGAQTSSRIAKETRDRILTAARKLNYRPNAAARALADRRMNTIGVAAVLVGDELDQYFLEVFNGVIAGSARANQNTTVFALQDWSKDLERLSSICDGRIDGLILMAPRLDDNAAKFIPDHTPFVSIHSNTALPGVVNLESDEESGAFEMVKHMISQGHKRILHFSGPKQFIGAIRRIDGYRRALETAKIKVDPAWIVEAPFDSKQARGVIEAWLEHNVGAALPEAIFCANDGIAIACIEALSARGFRVPQDVSVTGFDDTLIARTISPPLTTMRQPLRVMGSHAVEVLVARIENKQREDLYRAPKNIVFPTELVQRASVAQPHRGRLTIR